jgi:hypothetical protein
MRPAAILAVLFLALSGCAPLKHEETIDLTPGMVWDRKIDPPTYQQHLTVSIKSDKGGVEAYVVKTADLEAVRKTLGVIGKTPETDVLLGSHEAGEGPEDYSFEATIPAKTEYAVVLRGAKKTTKVTLSLVGR